MHVVLNEQAKELVFKSPVIIVNGIPKKENPYPLLVTLAFLTFYLMTIG